VPLVPFASVDRSALRWLRTGTEPPEFTLLSGDAPVAILRWAKRHGARATAETADGGFTLGRNGFLVPHLTIRREGSETPVGRLTNRLGHHDLEVGGGGTYSLRRAGLLLPAWSLSDPAGAEVAHLEAVAETRPLEGGAVLVSGSPPPPVLLVLLLLSWYLIVLSWFEEEAAEALAPLETLDLA
jgi:hypothetical protein